MHVNFKSINNNRFWVINDLLFLITKFRLLNKTVYYCLKMFKQNAKTYQKNIN